MRVLISGAGVAGPTLAWFLAKAGAQITIVEKNQTLSPHGQNVDLKGSAIKVVKKMGLLDQVRRFNTREKGTQFVNSSGYPFALFPIHEGSPASLTSEYEILRGDLAVILYEATKEHPNVNYLFGTTIKNVLSNDKDTVKVELSSGEVHAFDFLVAADGQWSKLRSQCLAPDAVKVVHTGLYTAYYTIPRLPKDNDWWNVYVATGARVLTLRPDPHGTIRAMFTHMPHDDVQETSWWEASKADRHSQEQLLKREFADAGWQAQRLLDAVDQAPDFYFHVIQQIKLSKWSHSRVAFLGDAAYAPSPLTGMGTSLAIIGAYILAGELSKLGEAGNPSEAFEAYEAKFRPFVEEAQKIPFFVPAIVHPVTAWKRWILHLFVWILSKAVAIPWLVKRLGDGSNEGELSLPEYQSLTR